ncbi:hypothetical protein CQ017_17190 [Arthrobacter sp. MYb224]|nr:hypothetical protein CQ017_17190 [Arthrobacter sp. MYb224]PRA01961.1 hypothetical protein CQ019_14510 [Arthrobacter sp. MYb229]PRB50470.1 hypothetical protein CQ013_10675 [Arthrobacter sp. MYb216]
MVRTPFLEETLASTSERPATACREIRGSTVTAPDFTEYQWDFLERGSVLLVTLSGPANLRLMDPENFAAFQDGAEYDFHGGMARKAPYRLKVPQSGPWFLAIDLTGLSVRGVRHAVSVEPPQKLVERRS